MQPGEERIVDANKDCTPSERHETQQFYLCQIVTGKPGYVRPRQLMPLLFRHTQPEALAHYVSLPAVLPPLVLCLLF